jgi:predicted TIM-barrel fold metal-dependent hydrolase
VFRELAMNRRTWLRLGGASLAASRSALQAQVTAHPSQPAATAQPRPTTELLLEYVPKSMLHLPETHVPRARFPVIDFHTHITGGNPGGGNPNGSKIRFDIDPADCLAVMDRKNIRTMVDLTGSYGDGLREAQRRLQEAHPGRFFVFTEPAWIKASERNYAKFQADQIESDHKAGAKGLKVLKTLGLYLREAGSQKLVRIDDARFDPMWETAGALKMPVAIHVSDPEAFFLPIDRFNEHWEELHAHPDWSFHGRDFPGNRDLQAARRNVMRRHPRTQFVCLHVADAEDLPYVSECMDSHPNMNVDIAARIGELGRQPRMARKFFDRYQDRILFGTDASGGASKRSVTHFMKSIIGFLRPRTSTSIMPRRRFRRRAAGGSMVWDWRNRFCGRFTLRMHPA